ncbi:hypothetical protein [Nonomuraea sp. NPDC050643]|uniref:hypothetical protein n=1 Tax=Nonomuraea sp. NPDC050643 TaxID=3155660 RepID=UPI0034025FA7
MRQQKRPSTAPMSRVLLTVTAVALTGCALSPEPAARTTAGEPAGIERVDPAVPGFTLPLDAFTPSPAQQRIIADASTILYRSCMSRLGIRTGGERPTPVTTEPNRDRYLLTDAAAARTRGYHQPEPDAPGRSEGESLPAEHVTAATGRGPYLLGGKEVPVGGCRGAAADALNPAGPAPDLQFVQNLRGLTWNRSQADERVRQVFAAWSACMKDAGHHYRTPSDANNDPRFASAEPTRRERATAVADVRCKESTGLARVWANVEAAYQREAIGEHAARLEQVRKAVAAQVAAATRVRATG